MRLPAIVFGHLLSAAARFRQVGMLLAAGVQAAPGGAARLPGRAWRRWWRASRSTKQIVVTAVLGAVITGVSLVTYRDVARAPQDPGIWGEGVLFVDDRPVRSDLSVSLDPVCSSAWGTPVTMTVRLRSPTEGRPTSWALLLTGDARLRPGPELSIPPGVAAADVKVGRPPGGQNEAAIAGQVLHGTVDLTIPYDDGDEEDEWSQVMTVRGIMVGDVLDQGRASRLLSLPRFGRVESVEGLSMDRAGWFAIGVDGNWFRPADLRVQVMVGDLPSGDRIDQTEPTLVSSFPMTWTDPEGLRPRAKITTMTAESDQQSMIFVAGALLGAGVALLAGAVERTISRLTS